MHLRKQGFTVAIPTLPGHGTYSGDLFNYSWRDWFSCVKSEFEALRKRCDEVFVCGLSMGGTLALHLAAHRPVQGVIALAAAVEFPGWQKYTVKAAKRVLRFRHKRKGEDCRDAGQKSKLQSYHRYPYSAVEQLFQLVEHVRQDLPEVEAPLLVMHSHQDHTIKFDNSWIIFNSVGSRVKEKIDLDESYHVITADVERERVKKEVVRFIVEHSHLWRSQKNDK